MRVASDSSNHDAVDPGAGFRHEVLVEAVVQEPGGTDGGAGKAEQAALLREQATGVRHGAKAQHAAPSVAYCREGRHVRRVEQAGLSLDPLCYQVEVTAPLCGSISQLQAAPAGDLSREHSLIRRTGTRVRSCLQREASDPVLRRHREGRPGPIGGGVLSVCLVHSVMVSASKGAAEDRVTSAV